MRASLEVTTVVRRVGDRYVAECKEMGLEETGETEEEAKERLLSKAEKLLLSSMVDSSMLT